MTRQRHLQLPFARKLHHPTPIPHAESPQNATQTATTGGIPAPYRHHGPAPHCRIQVHRQVIQRGVLVPQPKELALYGDDGLLQQRGLRRGSTWGTACCPSTSPGSPQRGPANANA